MKDFNFYLFIVMFFLGWIQVIAAICRLIAAEDYNSHYARNLVTYLSLVTFYLGIWFLCPPLFLLDFFNNWLIYFFSMVIPWLLAGFYWYTIYNVSRKKEFFV